MQGGGGERIDGRKGFLTDGTRTFYCLKHLGVEVSASGGFPEDLCHGTGFSQLVFLAFRRQGMAEEEGLPQGTGEK